MTATIKAPAAPKERKPMTAPTLSSLDQILSLADNGGYLPDLIARNRQLIADMQSFSLDNGGSKAKGSLKVTIDYTIDRFGQIEIGVTDTITAPKAPKAKAVAWTSEDGGLTAANPNQKAFEIRDVAGSGRELRTPYSD